MHDGETAEEVTTSARGDLSGCVENNSTYALEEVDIEIGFQDESSITRKELIQVRTQIPTGKAFEFFRSLATREDLSKTNIRHDIVRTKAAAIF